MIKELHPFQGFALRNFAEGNARKLHEKLCAAVLPKYGEQLAIGFRQPDFVARLLPSNSEFFEARCMLIDSERHLWKEFRGKVIDVLGEAYANKIVQQNAYTLMEWFDDKVREKQPAQESQTVKNLLSDKAISNAFWKATIATPLGSIAVARIRHLPDALKTCGVSVELPQWWNSTLTSFPRRSSEDSSSEADGQS